MCMIFLAFLLLSFQAIPAFSECPKPKEWSQMEVSPGGSLVCARFFGDATCTGLSLPFGINSTTSDLGPSSSSAISFERNNVTVLVRPGCNMYLWQGANFTGGHVKSTNYIWNVDNRHYRSALCNCSVDDLELLQCELREEWDVIKFCDFRKSDNGGLCSATLKHSYVKEGDGNETSLTITKSWKDLFADKILKSFGGGLITTLVHVDSNHNDEYFVHEWKNAIQIKQRSYVCGQYHFLTPEVIRHVVV